MKIILIGSVGAGNLGDETLAAAVLRGIRQNFPGAEVVILSGDPAKTSENFSVPAAPFFPVGRSFFSKFGNFFRAARAVRGADAAVIFGGLFQDEERSAPIFWLGQVFFARIFGAKIFGWGIGVGPLRTRLGRAAARAGLGFLDKIIARDEASQKIVENLGIPRPEIASDPAFSLGLDDEDFPEKKSDRPKYLLINARPHGSLPQKFSTFFVGLARAAAEQKIAPIFLVADRADREIFTKIRAELPADFAFPAVEPAGPADFARVVGGASGVVAMRLHALILAARAGVPALAIPYGTKVPALVERFQIPQISPENLENLPRALEKIRPADPAKIAVARKSAEKIADDFAAWARSFTRF